MRAGIGSTLVGSKQMKVPIESVMLWLFRSSALCKPSALPVATIPSGAVSEKCSFCVSASMDVTSSNSTDTNAIKNGPREAIEVLALRNVHLKFLKSNLSIQQTSQPFHHVAMLGVTKAPDICRDGCDCKSSVSPFHLTEDAVLHS